MKHAVVMSGGGAAAAFQVGVLHAMDIRNVKIDAMYGTSAGALNATGYAFAGSDKLLKMWEEIGSWRDLWSINPWVMVGRGSGLLNSKPLRAKIDKFCRGRGPKCPVCVTKVDLTTGELVYSYAGNVDFRESVEASAALPGIISPIRKRYSDGGIREVLPLKKAIDEGADKISVILCHPWSRMMDVWVTDEGFMGFFSAALRADSIRSHEVLKDDINTAIVTNANPNKRQVAIAVYSPNSELLGCLDFHHDKISRAITAGLTSTPIDYAR